MTVFIVNNKWNHRRASDHLSDLLLLRLVLPDHDLAFECAAVPVVENSLLGQEVGLLLGLRMLHVLLVL